MACLICQQVVVVSPADQFMFWLLVELDDENEKRGQAMKAATGPLSRPSLGATLGLFRQEQGYNGALCWTRC